MRKLRQIFNYILEEDETHYHFSNRENINEFRPMSHFGTRQAAEDRAPEAGHIYHVKLNKGNVAHIPEDSEYQHDPEDIANKLKEHNHITSEEHKSLIDHFDKIGPSYIKTDKWNSKDREAKEKHLGEFLQNKGIHTISYINDNEDDGSTSHIITHGSQAKIIKKEPYDPFEGHR